MNRKNRSTLKFLFFGQNRRGIALWVSWVLLTGFIVALSGLLLGWMQGYSKSTVETMKTRIYNSDICESISMSVDKALCKNPQVLNIVITNRNYFRINQIILRTYTDDKRVNVAYLNKTIKPTETVSIDVTKTSDIDVIEAIPVYFNDDAEHICDTKKITVSHITGNC